jgi:hypothetical protein
LELGGDCNKELAKVDQLYLKIMGASRSKKFACNHELLLSLLRKTLVVALHHPFQQNIIRIRQNEQRPGAQQWKKDKVLHSNNELLPS